jgi:ElaB/YqjD/DUF883 family membrane-anchored ribosome-binding protein
MTEDDTSAGGSKVPNLPGGSSGSNATAPSTISPSTSSACSQDSADATAAAPSTDARSTEPERAGYLNASSPASADDENENATSSARARVFLIRDKLADAGNAAKDRYRVVSESTDDFVHESPWKAIALATLTGVIVGMLAAR